MSEKEFQFESAFARLEQILDKMNSGKVPLDDSLKLYEEADRLIGLCSQKLSNVETKIEQMIQKRGSQEPQLVPFEHLAAEV